MKLIHFIVHIKFKRQEKVQIRELHVTTERGMGVAFGNGKGNISGGEIFSSKTNLKDYDELFAQEVLKIDPPYELENFLNYHYDEYQKENGAYSHNF